MDERIPSSVAAFASIVSPEGFSTQEPDLFAARCDSWPRALLQTHLGHTKEKPEALPCAVIWPQTTEQVRKVVSHARNNGLSLVPYGAGSGVVGGATARAGQVVVDLKRMRRVLNVDKEGLTAQAEVGIMGELFERHLQRAGFTQGHFPSSIYCSTLGGWIAARGAGQMSSRFGKIEDQLVGGVVVLGDGRVVTQRPRPARSALFDELIGAEGTQGIWTEATVRIRPLPAHRAWRALGFPNVGASLAAARAWLEAGITPAVMRIYDPLDSYMQKGSGEPKRAQDRGPNHLAAVAARFPRFASFVGDRLAGECRCVLGLEGEPDAVAHEQVSALAIATAHGGTDLGREPAENWFKHRYAVSYGISNAFRAGVLVDTMEVACSWERVLPAYRIVRREVLRAGAQVMAHFSHMYLEGASIYFTYAMPAAAGGEAYDRIWRTALLAATEAGANVSHHHGIGRLKADILGNWLGGVAVATTRRRQQLDPTGVLNPETLVLGSDQPLRQKRWPEPAVGEHLATAAPHDTLEDVEKRLRGQGKTLGIAASLLRHIDVATAASRRWLWRTNRQLDTIELAVAGSDGTLDGKTYRYVPAPRGAQGPDLTQRMLQEGAAERIWLRCDIVGAEQVAFVMEPREGIARGIRLAQGCRYDGARLALRVAGDRCVLNITLPQLAAHRKALQAGPLREFGEPIALPDEHLAPSLLFVSGTWEVLRQLAEQANASRTSLALPWCDAVGAAGFLYGLSEEGDDGIAAWRVRAAALGALPQVDEVPATGAVGTGTADSPIADADAGKATIEVLAKRWSHKRLALVSHAAALDNCTYCPKLCRFSCPVAVGGASETFTPRQLMLTANLDRTARRALTPAVAQQLWSCVDCGGCSRFCEHGVEPATVLQAARHELVEAQAAPPAITAFLRAFAHAGAPPDYDRHDDPAVGLEGDVNAPVHLFLGCQGSRRQDGDASRGALGICRDKLGATHVAMPSPRCCGHPLWRWGDDVAFRTHAHALAQHVASAQRIVADDPGCAYALGELYPQVGVHLPPVLSLRELLAEGQSHLTLPPLAATHDACNVGKTRTGPSLRQRLGAGDKPWGSVLAGEAGSCGGMLLPHFDALLAERVGRATLDDLQGDGARCIVVESPTCARRLRSLGAEVYTVSSLYWRQRAQAHAQTED